jgi:hypothetical protein
MTGRKPSGFPAVIAALIPHPFRAAFIALLPSVAAAALGAAALQDEFRWLAWLVCLPLFVARYVPIYRWTFFALLLNSYFLLPYQSAIRLEFVSETQAVLLYVALVALTVVPYWAVDMAERQIHRMGCRTGGRVVMLALAIWVIWLLSDHMLATKYWYALALDQAPLWLVRWTGEEGLAAAMIGVSAWLAWAFRETGGRRWLAWSAGSALVGWLCLGNPLVGESRAWPGIEALAIQPGIHASTSRREESEALYLLTGLGSAYARGHVSQLILLPELMAIPLEPGARSLSPYLAASYRYRGDILINGARPVGEGAFERAASLVVNGTLQSDSVPKRRLIPYYESLRSPLGAGWVAGARDSRRILRGASVSMAPLLCFEIFDRFALRDLQEKAALVVVAADTSSFGHPALSRYVVHAGAFQSQVARAPVVLINYSGPSAVLFPNGERRNVLERGATGYFYISPEGDVETRSFSL